MELFTFSLLRRFGARMSPSMRQTRLPSSASIYERLMDVVLLPSPCTELVTPTTGHFDSSLGGRQKNRFVRSSLYASVALKFRFFPISSSGLPCRVSFRFFVFFLPNISISFL